MKGYWNTSNIGDNLAFYVTAPISKIMGFGKISSKFIDENKIFPDEKFVNRAIWKFRFKFKVLAIVDDWANCGISVPRYIMLNAGRKVVDRKIFLSWVEEADQLWKIKILQHFI